MVGPAVSIMYSGGGSTHCRLKSRNHTLTTVNEELSSLQLYIKVGVVLVGITVIGKVTTTDCKSLQLTVYCHMLNNFQLVFLPTYFEETLGECSQKCYNMFVLETVCVAWFSLEFILRFIQAESKCVFLRTPLNIIDMMAILPYYITLIVDSLSTEKTGGTGNNYLEKVGLVLRVLRALRILYVMRLARHSLGLQTLGLTVRRCTREFGLLLLFLCVAMALFSPLVYLAENELGAKQEFTSIPGSYWWAVISMTTVGYGDMVPRSIPGQVVALSSILSGILLMAFPVTSIFHTFSRSYTELKEQQQRASRQLHRLEDREQCTDVD
ncbi:voltage-gated potassium channel regulatory subunit KCNG2-like [Mixophyes fleayi]|uniref:voltage-gated potassium channel regulatory subunit KCNG2-like n=1 Tax=Mixophyes fleayi TaxID=3061075 RepID=UPI003F4D71DA